MKKAVTKEQKQVRIVGVYCKCRVCRKELSLLDVALAGDDGFYCSTCRKIGEAAANKRKQVLIGV